MSWFLKSLSHTVNVAAVLAKPPATIIAIERDRPIIDQEV